MTRETKIGLLVGLAFIIVIGILLSDHMTSTNEPPKASLSVAASNVRDSVRTPAAAGDGLTQPLIVTAGRTGPNQPVLTREDIAAQRAPAAQDIRITNNDVRRNAATPVMIQRTTPPTEPVVVITPEDQQQQPADPVAGMTSAGGQELPAWAKQHKDEVVFIQEGTQGAPVAPQPTPPAGQRKYKAVEGDNLSKMATKAYGTSTRALREAIANANPSLQENPDKIISGRTYFIPAGPVTSTTSFPPPSEARRATAPPAASATARVQADLEIYVVQENDSLWSIAAQRLGSGNAWTTLRDLNKDVLKGGDTVQPNMKLKIPKTLSTASVSE